MPLRSRTNLSLPYPANERFIACLQPANDRVGMRDALSNSVLVRFGFNDSS